MISYTSETRRKLQLIIYLYFYPRTATHQTSVSERIIGLMHYLCCPSFLNWNTNIRSKCSSCFLWLHNFTHIWLISDFASLQNLHASACCECSYLPSSMVKLRMVWQLISFKNDTYQFTLSLSLSLSHKYANQECVCHDMPESRRQWYSGWA